MVRHFVRGEAYAYGYWVCHPQRLLVADVSQLLSGTDNTQSEKGEAYKTSLHKQSLY